MRPVRRIKPLGDESMSQDIEKIIAYHQECADHHAKIVTQAQQLRDAMSVSGTLAAPAAATPERRGSERPIFITIRNGKPTKREMIRQVMRSGPGWWSCATLAEAVRKAHPRVRGMQSAVDEYVRSNQNHFSRGVSGTFRLKAVTA